MEDVRLGIDFGGSGIKGALVNIHTGELTSDRHRIPTPSPATPESVSEVVKQIINHFNYQGEVGVAFPSAIHNGVIKTASNIDKSWLGQNAEEVFSEATLCDVKVINDADAAALAEMSFGKGKDLKGTGFMVTVGVGLGTAIFRDGVLIPNLELGNMYYKGKIAEHWASDAVRKKQDLSWKKWGKRFGKYLRYIEQLFSPDVIIIGGGASKKFEKYSKQVFKKIQTPIETASLQNQAGIIGSAVQAYNSEEIEHGSTSIA